MSKHTPGRWVADWCVDEWRVEDEHGRLVAGNIEDDRDARLIAAAPELLAALQDLMGLDDLDPEDAEDAVPHVEAAARAAIAKATQA